MDWHLELTTLRDELGRMRAVHQSNSELFDAAFTEAPHGIVICDAHGKVIHANPIARRVWASAPALTAQVAHCLHQSEVKEAEELRIQRHDDSVETLLSSAAPILGTDGQLLGAVCVFADLTRLRNAEQASRSAVRQELLAEAGAVLLSSVDYDDRLASLAQLAVPRFADWAAVDIVTPVGSLRRLAIAHVDPEKVRFVAELEERYPSDPNAPEGVHKVIRTGEHLLLSEIPDSLLVASTRDAQHLALVRGLGLRSCVCVPLIARGRTLGAVTFATAESGRAYEQADLEFAQQLARTAALAFDNANLFREAQEQRKQAEDAEARLRTLAGAIPQIVWATDPNGVFEYLSDRWFEFTGQSRDGSSSAERRAAVHPDDRQRVLAVIEAAEKQLRSWEVDYRIRGKDGTYRWFLGRGVPLLDEQGRLVKWYGTATDIDDQKRAVRSRDELLATVSHDLRNPLGNVLMATAILKASCSGQDEQSARVQKQLGVLERAGKRMETLIRDLLDIAALESGHLSVSLKPENPRAILAEVVDGAVPKAREQGLRIAGRSEFSVTSIPCDRDRILQVFENLLGNAFKFTPADGMITLGAREHKDALHFFVKDTGPGIARDQVPHVFDRYFQAQTHKRGGAGLGLAICKGIVELHGGKIWAESEPGAGTTIWFSLPLRRDPV